MVANASSNNGLMHLLSEEASEATHRVKESARAVKEQIVEAADQVGRAVSEEANKFINQKKGKAVAKVEDAGLLIRKTARVLHAGKLDGLAEYADMAAQAAERVSQYIEERDLDEMTADLGDLTRRHPLPIFGAVFLLGMAAARFVKAGLDAQASKAERHATQRGSRRR